MQQERLSFVVPDMRGCRAWRAPMSTDKLFLIVALVLTAAGLGYAYYNSPTTVSIAVGPAGSADDKLIRAFADQLKEQRASLRVRVVPVSDIAAAADRLDRGNAQFAVIRPDVKLPPEGLTVAVLRDAAIIVLAPQSSGIKEAGDLAGKALGVVRGHDADPALLTMILSHFEFETAVTIVPLERDAVVPALKDGRIQAAAIVAPASGTIASEFVRAIMRAYGGQVSVLSVESPDAISQRSPILVSATIPEGVWGGRPKQPDREVKTVGVSYRLMARTDADRNVVALLAEQLFQMRSRIAVVARSANLMRAPDMDSSASATSAILPNHPGAVDYFQRETQSFMDRYGDWVYLFAFFGSGLASAAMWFVQRFRRQRREVIDDVLDRLLAILAEARTAEEAGRLDGMTGEVDELLRVAVAHARTGAAGSKTTSALMLALEGARSAIDDRRRHIESTSIEPPRRGGPPRLVTMS